MTLLSLHGISQSYGGRQLFSDLSFSIEDQDRLGLIGQNGSGKTTLIRILAGLEEPESGQIIRKKQLSLSLLLQQPKLDPELSIEAAVLTAFGDQQAQTEILRDLESALKHASMDDSQALTAAHAEASLALEQAGGYNPKYQAEAIRDKLKLPPGDRQLKSLSLGEHRRVALAISLLRPTDLLILDEPTNHLDMESILWLESHLKSRPGALLLVTHDRYFLDAITSRMAELDRGRLFLFEGNYSEHLVAKAERDLAEARAESRRASAIRNELKWVRASAPARTTKQKARLERFDEMLEASPPKPSGELRFQIPHPTRIGKRILELEGVSKAFGDKRLIEGLSLKLKRGDRIGIVGPNGAGKTTLIRMILGEISPDAGAIHIGQNTHIIYADQGRKDLQDDNTVLKEVAGDSGDVFVGDHAITVQSFLSQLLFDSHGQNSLVGALSGGERSRVALAKSLREAGNLLILDEPTNDLDLATLRVLEDALLHYPGSALVISHDRYFLDRVATAILAFEGDGQVGFYEGSYALYRERHAARAEAQTRAAEAPVPREPKAAPPKKRSQPKLRRSFKEEAEFQSMEAHILELESEQTKRETELSDPESIRRLGKEVQGRLEALEALKKEIEGCYQRWAELDQYQPYGG